MPAKEFVAFTRLDASDVNAYLANKSISNAIINGAFDIWQRGTSFATPASGSYTADRTIFVNNGAGAAYTISRENNPVGSVIGRDEPEFFYRYNQTTAGTGGTLNFPYAQRVENVRLLAGKTVTLSAYIKTDSPRTSSLRISFTAGSGGSGVPSALIGPSFTTSTSWERYSFTTTIPNFSGAVIGTGNFMSVLVEADNNITQTFDIWGVQLEEGSVANDFRRNANSIQGELAACQRYFYRATNTSENANSLEFVCIGQNYATTASVYMIRLPVEMRSSPTLAVSSTSHFVTSNSTFGNVSLSSLALTTSGTTKRVARLDTSVASGLVAGNITFLTSNNASGTLDLNAEL
jgi:hypothetical protein